MSAAIVNFNAERKRRRPFADASNDTLNAWVKWAFARADHRTLDLVAEERWRRLTRRTRQCDVKEAV